MVFFQAGFGHGLSSTPTHRFFQNGSGITTNHFFATKWVKFRWEKLWKSGLWNQLIFLNISWPEWNMELRTTAGETSKSQRWGCMEDRKDLRNLCSNVAGDHVVTLNELLSVFEMEHLCRPTNAGKVRPNSRKRRILCKLLNFSRKLQMYRGKLGTGLARWHNLQGTLRMVPFQSETLLDKMRTYLVELWTLRVMLRTLLVNLDTVPDKWHTDQD